MTSPGRRVPAGLLKLTARNNAWFATIGFLIIGLIFKIMFVMVAMI